MGFLWLFIVIFFGYIANEACGMYNKPEILYEDREPILDPGNNFTVLCQGMKPLEWQTPSVRAEYSDWTDVFFERAEPVDRKFKYASRLYIRNISFPYVGYYKCHEKDDPEADEFSSKIYLYVKDPQHLAVDEQSAKSVPAVLNSDVVIPCRPTSPDVTVELLLAGEKMLEYDPKTGFKFYVSDFSLNADYVCQFSKGDDTFEVMYIVLVNSVRDSLPKPLLEESSGGHTVIGEDLIIKCQVREEGELFFVWDTPQRKNDPRVTNEPDYKYGFQINTLVVKEVTLEDGGQYICKVKDYQGNENVANITVKIYDEKACMPISLSEDNDAYNLNPTAGTPFVQWVIRVEGHPIPNLTWRNNRNVPLPLENTLKYYTNHSKSDTILKINDINISDAGCYTLEATNTCESETLSLCLNVTDKPTVDIRVKNYSLVDTLTNVSCRVAAYPEPSIYWSFKPCQDDSCDFESIKEFHSEKRRFSITSYVRIKSNQSGIISCYANNSIGEDEVSEGFFVSDVLNGFNVYVSEGEAAVDQTNNVVVPRGDNIIIACGVASSNYTTDMEWFYNSEPLQDNDDRYSISRSESSLSYKKFLEITSASNQHNGIYSCMVRNVNDKIESRNITLSVKDPSLPRIVNTNMGKDSEIEFPKPWEFYCNVTGIPKPSIMWLKNDQLFNPRTNRIIIAEEKDKLIFTSTDPKDEGKYSCLVRNRMGHVTMSSSLSFKNKPKAPFYLYMVCGALLIGLIAAAICMFIKYRNDKVLNRQLKLAGLENFENGAVENINPELGIDDQAELLPYDKKYEFPFANLKLGKQLGSGAFGVVMKATAKGIIDDEEYTTVAVKMVKRNTDYSYIKALASELKIMVHMGQHLNVVNLLGACTKNVAKRELFVIVEYCRFGNVQNYLLRHRVNFVNQIDSKTGEIDYTIGQEIFERTYSITSERSNPHSPYKKYSMSFSNSNGGNMIPSEMGDYRANSNYSGNTAHTESTTVCMSPSSGDDSVIMSNNSAQPEWRSNYTGDYKGNVRPICTKDLLAWAFQVSRGMEYLASKKVLHGDLAARNILLSDNNIVKICDFGLAKSMYKSDNYKKKGDGPLPVKWMAVESIRDRIFSTQSDVWSFGIVLWEFFSLARTPYPGMDADERLYNKLVDGYRMETPEYATKEIYQMMLDCWAPKPMSRPSFSRLTERIGDILEDSVKNHYVDLNDPYLRMNIERFRNGQDDYLAMVSPPDFENLSSPHHYVNEIPLSPSSELAQPGYLCMSAGIFSPRLENESVFDFNIANKQNESSEETGPEMIPMLHVQSESDCETPNKCNSPNPINSFYNPSYQVPPKMENEKDKSNNEKNIMKSCDNYVNMVENKNALKNNQNSNNPFISVSEDKNGVHYVNANTRDWGNIEA